jgi:hypothetical protein
MIGYLAISRQIGFGTGSPLIGGEMKRNFTLTYAPKFIKRSIGEIERDIHAAKADYDSMGEATPEWKAYAAKARIERLRDELAAWWIVK